MNIGEVIENAIWLDGNETPEQRMAYETMISDVIKDFCRLNHLEHGPVTFIEKKPGDDRMPEVPKHIEKKAGDLSRIRLLIVESMITGKTVRTEQSRFVDNLEITDLRCLRLITRRAHLKSHPSDALLTDTECDEIIENIGPESAIDALRKETIVSRYH